MGIVDEHDTSPARRYVRVVMHEQLSAGNVHHTRLGPSAVAAQAYIKDVECPFRVGSPLRQNLWTDDLQLVATDDLLRPRRQRAIVLERDVVGGHRPVRGVE